MLVFKKHENQRGIMKKQRISRRSFLNISATIAGIAAIQATPVKLFANDLKNKGKALPVLKGYEPCVKSIWVKNNEKKRPFENLKRLIESTTDFSWLSKGDKVLIKLALNSGNKFPATSDPFVLDGLVNVLKEKGAGEISACDQSGVEHVQFSVTENRGSSRKLCDTSGLLKVITENNITPVFFEEMGLMLLLNLTLKEFIAGKNQF